MANLCDTQYKITGEKKNRCRPVEHASRNERKRKEYLAR